MVGPFLSRLNTYSNCESKPQKEKGLRLHVSTKTSSRERKLFRQIYIKNSCMHEPVMFASLSVDLNQVEISGGSKHYIYGFMVIFIIWNGRHGMGWLRKNIQGTIKGRSPGIFNEISTTLRNIKSSLSYGLISAAYSYVYSAIQLADSATNLIFSCYCPNPNSYFISIPISRWRWILVSVKIHHREMVYIPSQRKEEGPKSLFVHIKIRIEYLLFSLKLQQRDILRKESNVSNC